MESLQSERLASPANILLSQSSAPASIPLPNGSPCLQSQLGFEASLFQEHGGLNLLSQSSSVCGLPVNQPVYPQFQCAPYLDQEVHEAEINNHRGLQHRQRRYQLGSTASLARRSTKRSSKLDGPLSTHDQYLYIRDIYRNNFPDVLCPSIDQVRSNACLLLKRFLAYEAYEKYRNKTNKSSKDAKWPNDREYLFFEACVIYPPVGRMKLLTPKGQMGRNELIALHIAQNTGVVCHRKQVSSHIQVLKAKCNYDPIIFSHLAKPEPRSRSIRYSSRSKTGSAAVDKFQISHFEMTVSANKQKVSLLTRLNPQNGQLADMDRKLMNKSANSSAYFGNLVQTIAPGVMMGESGTNLTTMLAGLIGSGTQVILVQATLDIPTYLPKGAELTVDFNVAGGDGLCQTLNGVVCGRRGVECSTFFYEGTRLLEKITRPVDFDSSDCSFKGVSLGSTFWANLIPRLVPKLRSCASASTSWLTDETGRATSEVTGRERVGMELKTLNAVQEISYKVGKNSQQKEERLLILVWHFELAEKSRQGELYWRHVRFTDDAGGKGGGEDDENGSSPQSPVIDGNDNHQILSLEDYLMAKGLYMNREQPQQPAFDFNNLDIPMPVSSTSYQTLGTNSTSTSFDSLVVSPTTSAFSSGLGVCGPDYATTGATFAINGLQNQNEAEMFSMINEQHRSNVIPEHENMGICLDMVDSFNIQPTQPEERRTSEEELSAILGAALQNPVALLENQNESPGDLEDSHWNQESPGLQLQAPPSSPQKLDIHHNQSDFVLPPNETNEHAIASSHALYRILGLAVDALVPSNKVEEVESNR